MLLFIVPMVLFVFLAVGAWVFVICATTRPLRRVALSAALWCAVWGPGVLVWVVFAGMVGFAGSFAAREAEVHHLHVPEFQRGFGIGMMALATLSIAAVATAIAWLHQVLARRMTFALFRLYATLVCAGVGSVWGWMALLALEAMGMRYAIVFAVVAMVVLIGGFGWMGYRFARTLRGRAPERLAWVTQEEFDGLG